jgi:hypothetical protein
MNHRLSLKKPEKKKQKKALNLDASHNEKKQLVTEDRTYEVSVFDTGNPYSIWNMVPKNYRVRLENVSRELLGMEEVELRQKVNTSSTLNKLRMAFWVEFDMACRMGRTMVMKRVYAGLCTLENFEKTIFKGNNLAWILTPVASYKVCMEEALESSIAQLRKVLDAPLFKNDGTLDCAAANTIIRVFTLLDQRVHGSIVQKIESKSLVVSRSMKDDDGSKLMPDLDIDLKLKQLETQITQNNQIVKGVPDGET